MERLLEANSRWDGLTFVVRFVCGFLFGILVTGRWILASFYDTDYPGSFNPYLCFGSIAVAVVIGLLAWWYGDRFWR